MVDLKGFHSDRGTAIVSVFSGPRGFPEAVAAAAATASLPVRDGRARAIFPGLSYGEYAISVLHDEDGDGEMAKGLFGAPREGFGFSGHPDYRFGPPDFAAVSFPLLTPQLEMSIDLRYDTARRQHQEEGRASGAQRPQE